MLHPLPQSPDLNPIENLWDQLDRNIRTTSHNIRTIRTITELKERLLEEWKSIPQEYLKKIICNMPKRLYEVIKQKSQPIKY